MGVKEFLKSRSGLRVDNRATTSAATLTLRQSLWPLTLVTTLFFLWVCCCIWSTERVLLLRLQLGLCVWFTGHPQLPFPENPTYRPRSFSWSSSSLLRVRNLSMIHILRRKRSPRSGKTQRIPPSLPRLRKLDPPQLRLQDRLYLRFVPIRHWRPMHVARRTKPILRRLLRCHIRHWIRTGFSRDSS